MAKGKTINMWKVLHVIGTGEALSFNVTQIFRDLIQQSLGGRVSGIPAPSGDYKISDSVLLELYEASEKVMGDPQAAIIDVALANLGIGVSHKIIKMALQALGAPMGISIGGYRLSWA